MKGKLTIEIDVEDCKRTPQWFELMDAARAKAIDLGMNPGSLRASFDSNELDWVSPYTAPQRASIADLP